MRTFHLTCPLEFSKTRGCALHFPIAFNLDFCLLIKVVFTIGFLDLKIKILVTATQLIVAFCYKKRWFKTYNYYHY